MQKIQKFGGEKKTYIEFSATYCVLASKLQKKPCKCKTEEVVKLFFQQEKKESMKSLVPHALHQCKQLPLLDRHPEWAEDIPQELITFAQTNDFWNSLHMLHEIHHGRIKEVLPLYHSPTLSEDFSTTSQGMNYAPKDDCKGVFPNFSANDLEVNFTPYFYSAIKHAINSKDHKFPIL
ncbi:MAG: hypothetical protein AAGI90_05335, partial [Chlamydiota bacterium]